MAHDTNNMLGVIVGYTDLLEERLAGDPQGVEDLDQIRKAAMRSSDLIRQLLAFARKQVIQPRQVDLNQLVEDTQRMLRRLIGENLALVWKPATSLWATWVDPSQVDQILANLVVNARDSIEGSGTITLETADASVDETFCHAHPDASPGEYVVLSVTDSGKGMTPEVQARIFEPFFTTKETGRGTGLGLATVYGILRQNGGFITVYSVPGSGSCFRLYFPRYAHGAAEDEAPAAEAPPPGGDETLLYVEDEEALLGLGKTILESAGYRVLAMSNPLAAKTLAERVTGTLDLLVTDLVMPGMNGWELWQCGPPGPTGHPVPVHVRLPGWNRPCPRSLGTGLPPEALHEGRPAPQGAGGPGRLKARKAMVECRTGPVVSFRDPLRPRATWKSGSWAARDWKWGPSAWGA